MKSEIPLKNEKSRTLNGVIYPSVVSSKKLLKPVWCGPEKILKSHLSSARATDLDHLQQIADRRSIVGQLSDLCYIVDF